MFISRKDEISLNWKTICFNIKNMIYVISLQGYITVVSIEHLNVESIRNYDVNKKILKTIKCNY